MLRDLHVAIIGAGMSGILAAIKLREAGIADVRIYEKADALGGTWRDNTYPGLACDVPSHLYTYSFAPNPDWSQRYSPGVEIRAYLERTAQDYGVDALIEYGAEVTHLAWEAPSDRGWRITLASGREERADCVIAATGFLHHPNVPSLEGAETFAGAMFHSARWDHGVPLDGARVGIIGTGSTAVQLVTALSERVAALSLFQRTAQWVLPGKNKRYSQAERDGFRRDPSALATLRGQLEANWVANLADALSDADSEAMAVIEQTCLEHLENAVTDEDLRARLRPSYRAGCKRLVVGEGFYEALQRPNARLVTAGIDRLVPDGVVTADGELHGLDVVVLATGFRTRDYILPTLVRGSAGSLLSDVWAGSPHAYQTVSVPGFPNFFMLVGPHSPVGNFPVISIAELQMDYILQLLERLRTESLVGLSASSAATTHFNEVLLEGARKTIWATGCQGWTAQDELGRPAVWPLSIDRFREAMQVPRFEDFEVLR